MNKSKLNEVHTIVNEIESKLKTKFNHASKHIYGDTIDFYYGNNLENRVEISYNDLHQAILDKTYPSKLLKLI